LKTSKSQKKKTSLSTQNREVPGGKEGSGKGTSGTSSTGFGGPEKRGPLAKKELPSTQGPKGKSKGREGKKPRCGR